MSRKRLLMVRLATLGAFAFNNNAGAGSIRTKHPVFKVNAFLLINAVLHSFVEKDAALHAIMAFGRHCSTA